MTAARQIERLWTADEFVVENQSTFGRAWRYELVEGRVLAHDAPEPEHGAILAGLIGALASRLRDRPDGCRPEAGSAAIPKTLKRNTARIPDAMVRCGEHPRVSFEVISPSGLRNWRGRDLKLRHVQAVEGVQEIVELSQEEFAAHVHRVTPGGWTFETLGGSDAILRLVSVELEIPLSEIYQFADIAEAAPEA